MPYPFTNEDITLLKVALPLLAMVVVAVYCAVGHRKAPLVRGILGAVLVGIAALSVTVYTAYQWRSGTYLNAYEFYHYYLGAKYAPELGYTTLYDATILAESELKRPLGNRTIRNLDSGAIVRAETVLRREAEVKAHFSPVRWTEFVGDVGFFRAQFTGSSLWNRMLNDKGYNATPVWTMVGGLLSNAISTSNGTGMTFLASLDVLFGLAAFICLWWAFGPSVAFLALIFVTTHYVTSHATLKAAFLRLDWVMCLTMAVAMLRKGKHGVAGALTAYAACVRVFPLFFAFAIGAKLCVDLVRWLRDRSSPFPRGLLLYFVWMGVTAAVLMLLSVIYAGGLDSWREFFDKVGQHNKDISPWRIGFKYVFLMSYQQTPFYGGTYRAFFENHQVLWWSVVVAVLLLTFWLVRRLEDHETLSFGYVPVFFLVAPTYYYHVMLVVPFLFFAHKIDRPTRAAGLLMMFATAIAGHRLFLRWDRTYTLFFTLSCLIFVMVLYMMALAAYTALRKPPATETEKTQAA